MKTMKKIVEVSLIFFALVVGLSLKTSEAKASEINGIPYSVLDESNVERGVSVIFAGGHVQSRGDVPGVRTTVDGTPTIRIGTVGKSLRLEGFILSTNIGRLKYKTHIQNIGWQEFKNDGVYSGTKGKSLRTEAVIMELTNSGKIQIRYRAHIQGKGWTRWVNNGEVAGTTGEGRRLEAIDIQFVVR